jgi:propionate CoA-transferase
MGMAEVDTEGNVNVSRFGTRTMGCGGFIDITQSAKKVVFCATFTTGGLEAVVRDGMLSITQEGSMCKFVDQVSQVTFNGHYSRELKQPVLFVTERAVFQLEDEGLTLIEIAPGIDLHKDILEQMKFRPIVAKHLKLMDARIFEEHQPMNFYKSE